MNQPYVIIGGDAAGMSAASKIKRMQPKAEVIVFERGEHISYSACGMPYWIGGIVESDEELLVLTPEKARNKRGIDVRMHHEVTAIDRSRKQVSVHDLASSRRFVQPYGKLVIATGASAVKPPIPGMELPGVFTLRNLSDSQRIHAYIAQHAPQHAVIIGGGYIGIEMAEALIDRGLSVHVVEMLPQILPNFDAEIVADVAEHVTEKGVHLHTDSKVYSVEPCTSGGLLVTASEGTLNADLVLVAVGVRPNGELASAAGLRMGEKGAIWVDDHMRTDDEEIYAAGDCVEHYHLVLGKNSWIPLAPSANKGGRVAGANAAGGDMRFPGILGTLVVKVFDYTMSATGVTEGEVRDSGRFGAQGEDVGSVVISSLDRAGYWPGVEKMKVKLIYQKSSGRILGCQLAGKAGVNKRIDIVATAIAAGMTVDDLGMLDLSYAPPYSPVYDPVQVAANVAAKE
ncbi:MAG: FAD-dependent oxidoreductase [Caldilineaceae bacterium]|nr:FAD-dependent oxidoreductase [Caldilineaceae bacterium]